MYVIIYVKSPLCDFMNPLKIKKSSTQMKRTHLLISIAIILAISTMGQPLKQTIRGRITDADSKSPLIGATVMVENSSPILGAITDINGNYRIDQVPTGRICLQISYIGYAPKLIPNVVVNSGKEMIMDVSLQESIVKMEGVTIVANKNKGEPVNDMATISVRSISPEETNRYAGGFNDPSRIMSNFAGITSTQDGSNDIIVRGNSPKYVQWRLEGIEISNPNHFADQSSVGGSVSTLNNNLLSNSDFYTGAFTAEFGDALSGVYDVRLRSGNNEQFESVFGFGLLGTDLTFEGPFKQNYGGSFLANYRYSTATIVSDLGLLGDDLGGIPRFQDGAFKIVLPTKGIGTFSLFGLGGRSDFYWEDVTPAMWETPGDRGMMGEITEDFRKKSHLLNTGLNHTINVDRSSYFHSTFSFSSESIADDVFEKRRINLPNETDVPIEDSLISEHKNFSNRFVRNTYRISVSFNKKFNPQHKIQVGTKYRLVDQQINQSKFMDDSMERLTLVDMDRNISTVRNFISWRYRINESVQFISGIHNMNVLLNKKWTFEPRVAMNWDINSSTSINAGYGLHSSMESVHAYFTEVRSLDGSTSQPNQDLDLLKAHHFVLGTEKRLNSNLRAKLELYYQDLYDIPVENDLASIYSTVNETLDFQYVDLVNKGTGRNYGIELTLEKFFSNNYYYLINGSVFESKYTALDGVERNTQFNGNYLVNVLFGKEFERLGKNQNQTFGLNTKVFFGGGRKVIPLLRDEAGNLAVNPDRNQFWDYDQAYENDIEDTYMVIVSGSYKWNKPKSTHELFLNLDNVTNHKGKITEFYDESEPDNIGNMQQFGFFPNLMYRVYF